MFIPISDDNRLAYLPFQYVTAGLIAANAAVYLLFVSGLFVDGLQAGVYEFGVVPAVHNDYAVFQSGEGLPDAVTLVTYQFWHAGFLHLISNMAFLWVFGDNVEDAMGHWRFLAFYLLCGIAAALAHNLAVPASEIPLIGASGSVAGVVAAYLMLHPRVKVWILVLSRVPVRLSAMWVLGFWIVLQFVMVAVRTDDGVAWWAHIGGLAAGAVLVVFLRRRGVPLFDRGLIATVPPT